jgi:hypothetical protein
MKLILTLIYSLLFSPLAALQAADISGSQISN